MPCLFYGELPELHCRSLRLSSDCKIGWFPAKINWEYDNWNKLQVFMSANSNTFIFTTPPPPPSLPFFSPGLLCPGQKIENERSGYNNGQKLPSFWPPRPPRALVSCADSEMLKKRAGFPTTSKIARALDRADHNDCRIRMTAGRKRSLGSVRRNKRSGCFQKELWCHFEGWGRYD